MLASLAQVLPNGAAREGEGAAVWAIYTYDGMCGESVAANGHA